MQEPELALSPTGLETEPGTGALDILIVLAKHKRMIVKVTFGAAIVSALLSLLLPNIYTARAVIMPPQEDQSTAAMLVGQLTGGGSGIGGGVTDALGLKSVNDLYVGLLKSRTVADRLIEKFKLKELYDKPTLVQTRLQLWKLSAFTAGKDGLIVVEFDDKDAVRAAAIANAYVDELDAMTRGLATTQASYRRLYYENQLTKAKTSLEQAEGELKRVQQETGIIKLDDQAKSIFDSMASIRGQIASKEVQIEALKMFATDRNPDLLRARGELTGLQKQLSLLQKSNATGDGDILVPTGKMPELGLEYLRKLRDVTYNDALFQALSKQFEIARIEEGKTAAVIQTIDKAVVLDRKSKPVRSLIVIVTAIVFGMLAVLAAFLREKLERFGQDPVASEKITRLLEYAKWKRG